MIKQAEIAANLTKESMKNEEEDVGKLVNQLDEVIKESLPSTVKEAIRTGEIFTTNKKIKDANGKTMTVPEGFKVIEGTNIDEGIVIADSEGNEFVWVPCENGEYKTHEYNNTADDKGKIVEDRSESGESNAGWNTWYYRAYSDWKDDVDEEENKKSVLENKGFYIARYEAGVPKGASFYVEASSEGTKTYAKSKNDIGTDLKPVSKKGMQAWNLIEQANAKTVSGRMYSGDTYGVRSQLVDGTAWDTAVTWMSKEYKDIEKDSTNYGNYYDTPQKSITGLYAEHTKNGSLQLATSYTYGTTSIGGGLETKRIEMATGLVDEFKLKNIYDMAGNIYEWTTEYGYHDEQTSGTKYAVLRGGSFDYNGSGDPVSDRHGRNKASNAGSPYIGFRVVLYVK